MIQLPHDAIAVGMHVNAQLDPLGFDSCLCLSREVGIGVWFCFHHNLGVARFRSPANTHAIYPKQDIAMFYLRVVQTGMPSKRKRDVEWDLSAEVLCETPVPTI